MCVPVQTRDARRARPGLLLRRAAARAATSPRIRPTTNLFYSGSQGALITRFDKAHRADPRHPALPALLLGRAGQRAARAVAVDVPDRVRSVRCRTRSTISSQHVWKTTNDGQIVDADQPGPDARRSDDARRLGRPDHARHERPRDLRHGLRHRRRRPCERGLIWTGSDDGLVHVTRDGGKNWANVTPPGLGDYTRISTVEPSPHKAKAGTAYVAGKRYLVPPGDRSPYLFRTDDYGKTWTKIVTGIAPHHYTHSIREDPKRGRACSSPGTEHGVYVSFDDGAQLAVAAPQPARHADLRPRGEGRRPGGRHARPLVLGAREHLDAAPADAGHGERAARPCSRRARRFAASTAPTSTTTWPTAGDEDRRSTSSTPRDGSVRVVHADRRRREGRREEAGADRRRRRIRRRTAAVTAVDQGGHEPLLVEPPLPGRHDLPRHDHLERQPRQRPAGGARLVSGAGDGQRPDPHGAAARSRSIRCGTTSRWPICSGSSTSPSRSAIAPATPTRRSSAFAI